MTTSIDAIGDLRRRLRGEVVTREDPSFDDLRRTFNAMLDRRPRLIARPVDAEDVATAVRWAAEQDLPISIRGGGHSVAGHAVGEDALMIDLGLLRRVTVDAEARVAEAGGGALLGDLDGATTAVGLAAPSGTYTDTGVGGLTLTGGIGYILGLAGFACDALTGAELVTTDGEVIWVDGSTDPELLWALRGGGGNFGVVTRFRLDLAPLGHVYGGSLKFRGPAVPEVLRLLFELQADAPDEVTLQGTLRYDPNEGPIAGILGMSAGDPDDGERAFAPFRAQPGCFLDEVGPISYMALQMQFERMGSTYRHYWKGHFVDRVDAALQQAVLEAATSATPDSVILIEPIHGFAHRVPEGHAAFGARAALANISALAVWDDPAEDTRAIDWARRTADALQPFSLRGGGYLNYASGDEPASRVEQAFGSASFARLRAVKRRLDPANRFRFNANIPPA